MIPDMLGALDALKANHDAEHGPAREPLTEALVDLFNAISAVEQALEGRAELRHYGRVLRSVADGLEKRTGPIGHHEPF